MQSIIDGLFSFKHTAFTIILFVGLYFLIKLILDRQVKGKPDWGIIRSVILFGIALTGVIAIILALPMGDSLKGQITSLIGIVISAVLALSSATLIGNGLAGIMIRTINSFKPGDFIITENHFGRVTERGFLHTEIQNEDRDLTTIPNMFLATNPVKVMRSSGTFVEGTVSLGYDVHRAKVEKALLEAAQKTGLKDPFVRIMELGDFSIIYKIYGLLEDVKTVLSARSRLNAHMLDCIHQAGIEIVSPGFVNQRQYKDPDAVIFIPEKPRGANQDTVTDKAHPEKVIFDKADEAESFEKKKEKLSEMENKISEIESLLKDAPDEEAKNKLEVDLAKWNDIKAKFEQSLHKQFNKIDDKA